jgi:ELWxxDGT repeat protein
LRKLPLLLLVFSLSAFAEEQPYLVRDLPGYTVHDSISFGGAFWTTIGNTTWFIANPVGKSIEVFKSDGTTAGTQQVTHGNGVPESQFLGPFLGVVRGKLVYGGIDSGGEGVFALDTNGGDPVLLGRFQVRYLTNGVVRGETLFFSGRETSEHELWRTDGTAEGTSKIDLLPGDQGAFNAARDTSLLALDQWMFFYGTTPQGTGLHRTDGTAANTTLLLPLSTSALFNDTRDSFRLADRLLFSIADHALWATDGTPAGTVQIATVSRFTPMGVAGGKLLFDGGGLWTTDGTAAGTRLTDVFAGTTALLHSGHGAGNRLYLSAETIEAGAFTLKLYVTEGTASTTRAIMKIDQHGAFYLGEGFVIGEKFYFRHDDGIHGMELWRTDGTTAEMFADINPGYRRGIDFIVAEERPDGKVIFAATEFNTGREPWITDGTAAGTHLLANCAPEESVNGSSPSLLRANGEGVFFVAHLAGGQAIGVSDGTSSGTSAALVDFPWAIASPAAANNHYFFSISTGPTGQLYSSDGTLAGTTPIYEQQVSPHAIANGILFAAGRDLWFSDGSVAATRKIHTFDASSFSLAFFSAGEVEWITQGSRPWTSDGTEAGTVELIPSQPPTGQVYEGIRAGPLTYFIESGDSNHSARLWRSDGTAAGTTIVKDLAAQTVTEFVGAAGRFVYFNLNGKLNRSDGTESGTIELPVSSPCIFSGAAIGDALALTSFASNGTVTVWRSDGTAGGTTQLAAMPTKDPTSGCKSLTAHGNAAYFSGWDANHGWELWTTDATSSGTKLLADIYPGTKSSLPAELTRAGDRIFFSADSPNIGRELWAIGGHSITRRRASHP